MNIKKQQSSDQSGLQKDNATECEVFLMMNMEFYNGEIAKNGVWGLQRRTRKKCDLYLFSIDNFVNHLKLVQCLADLILNIMSILFKFYAHIHNHS